MMTAFREQVTYVFLIQLVQQIVENYETRFTVLVTEILGNALDRLLAVTPDDCAAKVRFRTQRIEMLHKTQGKR